MSEFKHLISEDHAAKVAAWFRERGGVLVWASVDLCDIGKRCTTPIVDAAGQRITKPSWQYANEPAMEIHDPADVGVVIAREVKRFRVGVRVGSNGLRVKCTAASSRRIDRELKNKPNTG